MSLILQLQQLQGDSLQQLQALYHSTQFPMEVRYYCAQWIESQNWTGIDVESAAAGEPAANVLLQQMIQQINLKVNELTGEDMFPIRLKLTDFSRDLMNRFSSNPLNFVRTIRHCLEQEQQLVSQAANGEQLEGMMPIPDSHREIESAFQQLKWLTQDTEKDLSEQQQKQELFVFQYQETLRIQARLNQLQHDGSNPQKQMEKTQLETRKTEVENMLQAEAQQLLKMRIELAEKHKQTFQLLANVQNRVLEDELIRWKRQQQLAGIGGPPEGTLDTLQCWCEALAELTWQNRQQIKKVELLRQQLPMKVPGIDLLPELNTSITALLSTLVTSTFIIEKQPPQVLKKETRFSASVRLLVGGKLNVHMNPPQVKATIISEVQAKALLNNESSNLNETCGDILNNCGVMEFHRDTGVLNVTFRNMSLKRIRRADRRGSEFVTEEKFTILFQSQFTVASGELVFQVRTMSLPVVVIVHGNQESNALATVLWDNAFAEPGRVPFVVPDKVPWNEMGKALNSKFMAANGRSLSQENLQYLSIKAFSSQNLQSDNPSQLSVSWSTFNRDPLPGRTFTFWKWFHGVLELTRKHLRQSWNDGTIMGFVSRTQAQDLLLSKPNGTFLLRFSDSEIGGITIAWVAQDPQTNERQVWNLQPFTAEDFNIRTLADRIHDLPHLTNLYPDIPKDTAFGNLYTPIDEEPPQNVDSYVSTVLVCKTPKMPTRPASLMTDNPATPSMVHNEPLSPPSMNQGHTMDDLSIGNLDENDLSSMLQDDAYDDGGHNQLNIDELLTGLNTGGLTALPTPTSTSINIGGPKV
ncbi:signal transducer and activator of transcription 5B-like isoform X2 [Amphiura filiformis]|uniref:signal transducer and activator of transcription 5B-like isoform X2 n=1 Tax=Amphiura filiformis TaxID=82378 RepID=UPI003B22439F